MQEAVVLFSHFRNDQTTRQHLDLLRRFNDFPVVPLCCDDLNGCDPVETAIQVPMTFTRATNWHNLDWLFWEWYRSVHRINAHRYIWLDWDCRVDIPLKEWYGEYWHHDFVASNTVTPPTKWYWFRTQRPFLPHTLAPFACGVTPLNGVLLSRRAMATYANEELPEGIFCELRVATVLASRGINASSLPKEKAARNVFLPKGGSLRVSGPGFYHPIKTSHDTEEIGKGT